MMEPELCDSLRKRSLPPAAFTLFPERSQEAPLTPRKRVSDTQAENPIPTIVYMQSLPHAFPVQHL